LLVTWC